jgi:predicted lipid-binding transport protein (Tim44 family)
MHRAHAGLWEMPMRSFRSRVLLALCAFAAAFIMIASTVDAAPRFSFGSRGSRTFTPPPVTQTAPTPARPMERSLTQPAQPGTSTATRPATAPQPGGFFNRPGLFGGLLGGFLGAGLFGLLFGSGFFGGLGGFASLLGLILQIGLIAMVGYLLWSWWQRRSQPAFAGGASLRDNGAGYGRPRADLRGAGGQARPGAPGGDEIGLMPADFDSFERLLGEIQDAYGAEELGRLRDRLTPEMLSYFAEELAANASRGVVNRVAGVKLLQGDLAEAWREGNTEYATVAMRYAIDDRMVERASGRVVEGGPQEVTEMWTFMRARGGSWLLSAIQQV